MMREQPDDSRWSEKCPPVEDLSAWVDDEAAGAFGPHVRRCRHCGQIVAVYRRINVVVRRAAVPPSGLAERILAECHARASARARGGVVWTFPRFLATAAALAVLGVISMAAWRNLNRADSAGPAATIADERPDGAVASGAPPTEIADGAVTPLPPSGAVVTGKYLTPVATSAERAGRRRVRMVRIPPQVTHIWVVRDVDEGRKFLESHLPDGAQIARDMPRSEHIRDVVVAIRDDRLPALVRQLSSTGWKLLSSAQPQPDAGRDVAWVVRRQPVYYNVRLVDEGGER